jgi:hypothetical protein
MRLSLDTHRMVAMLVMGILVGFYRYHDYLTWNQRGKDAFINHQLQRFDRYMAHPHSLIFTMESTAVAYVLILGVYELIRSCRLQIPAFVSGTNRRSRGYRCSLEDPCRRVLP